jgi:hypothetical protein
VLTPLRSFALQAGPVRAWQSSQKSVTAASAFVKPVEEMQSAQANIA